MKLRSFRNPLRTNQFYMNEMTSYAASLTGAKGKALDAETITVGPKKLVKLVEEKPPKPEKVAPKSKKEEEVGTVIALILSKFLFHGMQNADCMKIDQELRGQCQERN